MSELFHVLVAEDDTNDVLLLKRALKNAGVLNSIHVASDGQEAIDYISGFNKFSDRRAFPVPGLLFLDIKMPRQNGFEVLQWIREKSELRQLPVIVTSSSQLQPDVDRAYALGANAYLVKPVAVTELAGLFSNIAEYLARVVKPKFDINHASQPGPGLE
jgi:CheY-like chemotaxis protein